MNILVISHMYPSAVNRTYGIFVHEHLKALREQGCNVTVISPVPATPFPLPLLKPKWRDYSRIPDQDTIDGIKVYYPRYLEIPGSLMLQHSGQRMYHSMAKLVKKINKHFRFDLVHAHVALPDGQAGTFLKREYGVPLVVTIHGQDFQTTINRGEAIRTSLFAVLRQADKIITVSGKLQNVVKEFDFYSKTSVIHNGIAEEFIRPESGPYSSSPYNALFMQTVQDLAHGEDYSDSGDWPTSKKASITQDSVVRLLSVSNLKKTKGVDLTIKAMAQLVERYPMLQLDIVGDGEEKEGLQRLVQELKLEHHVNFLGKLPHEQVIQAMAEADIFCLPSWQEGFGVVYIEAMAQGLPVIGVKGEGIEDAVTDKENGLLVEPQSVNAVVQALDYLLSDPERARRIARNGYETVKQRFTWKQNALKTMELYKAVLAARKESIRRTLE